MARHLRSLVAQTYGEFVAFVRLCNDAVKGLAASSLQPPSSESQTRTTVDHIVEMLGVMGSWVDDIPPLDAPMRFGNKAFRWVTSNLQA